jgi:hypothetical protein
MTGQGDPDATIPPLEQAALHLQDLAAVTEQHETAGYLHDLVDLLTDEPHEAELLRQAIRRGYAHGPAPEAEWIAAGLMAEADDE